jgi:sulfur carrier protein
MISVCFNDQIQHIESTQSLHCLLIQNQLGEQHFAVAVNDQLVPRVHHQTTQLNDGDRIDIIVPMQGG